MNCKLSIDSRSNYALFRVRKETPRFALEDLREENGVPLAMVPTISLFAALALLSFCIFSFSITLSILVLILLFFAAVKDFLGEDFALSTVDGTILACLLGDVTF